MAVRFPKEELIIVILANSSRFDDTQNKVYQVADVLLKEKLTEPPVKKNEFTYITLPEKEIESHAGLYTQIDDKGLGRMAKLTYDKPDLYTSPNYYWKGLKLNPVSSDFYVAKNPSGETIGVNFSGDSAGKYISLTYRDNPPRRYTLMKQVTVSYNDFKGSYFNKSTGATIKVKSKKNKLVARKGILRIPLIAFGNDQFYGPANDVLFIFGRNEQGRVSTLKANAPDFRNFMFMRK